MDVISSGNIWIWVNVQLPRCSKLGSWMTIAPCIKLVCGAERSSVEMIQLHGLVLFLAIGKICHLSCCFTKEEEKDC